MLSNIVSSALLLLAPLLVSSAAIPELAPKAACNKYVIIATRGTTEPQGPSIAFPGMINQTLAAVPGGVAYDTVYPAGDNTQGEGTADIVRYIDAGLQACPSQKYVLLGYSQGAVAVAGALINYNSTTSAGFKAISAALVVGNPVHIAKQKANTDQNGGKATYLYTGVYTYRTDLAKIPASWYATTKLRDICYTDDIVCVGIQLGSLINVGANHGKYGSTPSVQTQGSQFLIPLVK